MQKAFPESCSPEEFERIRRDDERLRPGVLAICRSLALGDSVVRRFPQGSLPVYAVGEALVLKVYPPFDRQECERESVVLRRLHGQLPIPTPAVRDLGELEGWSYLLMERLRGECLVDAWPSIPVKQRLTLAAALGQALGVLHSIEAADLPTLRIDWARFIGQQRRDAVDRQRGRRLDEHWLRQIPAFLDRVALESSRPSGLLHTEVMREHLLVQQDSAGWSLTGLLDFEPAMVGAPEYEFASVGLFFSCGDAPVLRRVLSSYGYADSELGPELEDRLMAYALLHRYSNLPWYLSRLPRGHGPTDLRGLAAHWWGTGIARSR